LIQKTQAKLELIDMLVMMSIWQISKLMNKWKIVETNISKIYKGVSSQQILIVSLLGVSLAKNQETKRRRKKKKNLSKKMYPLINAKSRGAISSNHRKEASLHMTPLIRNLAKIMMTSLVV
jgi:3-phosphoglycerate kinase